MIQSCAICENNSKPTFEAEILSRHRIRYYCCGQCGFLQTERPAYWLDESYADAITLQDTGLVQRNQSNARHLEPLLHHIFPRGARFVDIGGGYGMLTRLLRDRGFDCYTTDPFCEPILARGFEPVPGLQADALFAFEVMEHAVDPISLLREAFKTHSCNTIFFSTRLFEGAPPSRDWAYYGFEHGQHVSIYQTKTLEFIACMFGTKHYALPHGLHLFTDRDFFKSERLILTSKHLQKFLASRIRKIRSKLSLTVADSRRCNSSK